MGTASGDDRHRPGGETFSVLQTRHAARSQRNACQLVASRFQLTERDAGVVVIGFGGETQAVIAPIRGQADLGRKPQSLPRFVIHHAIDVDATRGIAFHAELQRIDLPLFDGELPLAQLGNPGFSAVFSNRQTQDAVGGIGVDLADIVALQAPDLLPIAREIAGLKQFGPQRLAFGVPSLAQTVVAAVFLLQPRVP